MGVIGRWLRVFLAPAVWLAFVTGAQAQFLDGIPSIWNGVYAGVHAGGNLIDISSEAYGYRDSWEKSSPFGGIHVGFLIGRGNLAGGIEGDFNFETASESAAVDLTSLGAPVSASAEYRYNASASVRGRLGYSFDNLMIYGTVGYAWADTSLDVSVMPGGSAHFSQSFEGLVFGAGVEAFVMPRVRLRVEALHYDYATIEGDLPALPSLGVSASKYEIDPSATVIRAGVTFKLN